MCCDLYEDISVVTPRKFIVYNAKPRKERRTGTYCMHRVELIAPHAFFGLRKRQRVSRRLTVSSLRYSPLSKT